MIANKPIVEVPLPAVEEVAQAIVSISTAMKQLRASRLTENAIFTLLYAQCKGRVNKSEIALVINELGRMDKAWLKPLEKKESK